MRENNRQLAFINSIRGIAILMVVLVHTANNIDGLSVFSKYISSYGQMGVQLFFVASAYTLCLSAEYRSRENHKLKKYFIRRFFRISPIYYLGILIYFIVRTLIGSYENQSIIIESIIKNKKKQKQYNKQKNKKQKQKKNSNNLDLVFS